MVSDQEIASCVESLLRQSDPGVAAAVSAGADDASLSGVVRQVEAKLGGVDLSDKADFIRGQIDLLLGTHRPLAPAPALAPVPPPAADSPAAGAEQVLLQHPVQQIPPISSSAAAAAQPLAYRPPPPLPDAAMFTAYHLRQKIQQQLQRLPPRAPPAFRPPAASGPNESASTGVKRRGGPGGLNKVCGVSPELQVIVGEATMPRTQIVKQLWAYIRKNNLQDPSNKRKIICNDELRVVFETDSTDMFKMNKLLAKHILPLERTKDEGPDSKRLRTVDEVAATEPDKSQSPMVLSNALGKFFGTEETEMLQSEALKRLWEYIKANQLEDSEDGSILCDSKLQELFGCESLTASALSEMLAHHLHKQS